MTIEGYRAILRSLGLTPCRESAGGKTLHISRDGLFQQVPDPEFLSEEEREAMIMLLKWRMNIKDN